jgi:hypothetical protein
MSRWDGHPKPGSKWKRPAIYSPGRREPAETRHVIDRTLGGDVLFVPGRWSQRHNTKQTCTLAEWDQWAHPYAKQQPPSGGEKQNGR